MLNMHDFSSITGSINHSNGDGLSQQNGHRVGRLWIFSFNKSLSTKIKVAANKKL